MELADIMLELKSMGNDQTKKILKSHGAPEPIYGVKISDLKTIVKKVKKNHELSLALYETGISDAQYLAGLIADENRITKDDLKKWVNKASWQMLIEYTVPWVASESRYGFELGKEWILSNDEKLASVGWNCLSGLASIKPDKQLDIPFFKQCLETIEKSIHQQPDRVKYCMNNFVIAVGTYISELTSLAKKTALVIGKVSVTKDGSSCKVPDAKSYIEKVERMGKMGVKRKTTRC